MDTELRQTAENNFGKDFSKLVNNAVEKTMKIVRKYRDIKLALRERRRNYLVSEQNDQTKKIY